ncbi:ABC transporter ATP-binding protein [Periweissella cryptocerci]|uniref:ABC transporter ATP-binding protein n=1 Tax=Periweissella cryptocerci TaxID=2506420 RepID=A0A4P6YR62_9LACO|nr:ABC transporter ATP-binding protein [Periweissella cryptocerci]QBO35101.1 ABC transporter ATP-binding protein [Periweissella cryptocerci]
MEKEVTLGNMFRYVFATVLQRKGLLVVNVVALLIITGLQFIIPQFTQHIIDTVIPDRNVNQLFVSVGLMLLTVIMLGLFNFVSGYLMSVLSQNSVTTLRKNLYAYIIRLDTHFFESSKTGDLMVRLTQDINNLQSLISPSMLAMVGNLLTFVGVLIFIFIVNWQMALAVSVTLPIIFLLYRFFRSRIRDSFKAARTSQAKMSNQMQNTLTEIELIKSYTSEDAEENRFNEYADENKKYTITANKYQAIFSPLVDLVNYFGTAVILLLGAYFVMQGSLKVGQLVAYMSYVVMLQNPVAQAARLLNQLQQALVSYGRIMEVLAAKREIVDSPTAQPFPTLQTGITLQNVSFAYDTEYRKEDTIAAIQDVSFQVPAQQTIALVGHSGSGKTTITKLLDRLYDLSGGSIAYDGVEIQQIQLESLRQNIAIVSQDINIIDGTIRDNITYGHQDATDEEVWEVAQLADIAEFIHTLPQELTTQVGERGVKLSGGQKQRISIARALLKDAPIIILDEATAALDNESEKAIQHALDNLMQQRTSIVIAHRLSTVHNADNIIVMDAGHVVEQGNHKQLLALNGQYRQLYDAQFE